MKARGAVGAIAANELRHRWRSFVAIGLLAGIVGGVVLGVVVLARRTQTAYHRLEDASRSGDARVTTVDRDGPRAIRSLSVAREVTVASTGIGRLAGDDVQYASIVSVPSPRELFKPVILEGREPRARSGVEVMIGEGVAKAEGIKIGDVLRLAMLTKAQVASFGTDLDFPRGPVVVLKVVGIARFAAIDPRAAPLITSTGFVHAYPDVAQVANVIFVELRPGAAAKREFAQRIEGFSESTPPLPNTAGLPLYSVDYTSESAGRASATTHVLVTGLIVFAVVAAIAGLLALAQVIGRQHQNRATDQQIESALGITPRERISARVIPALVAAGIAGVVAATLSVIAGVVEPLGAIKQFEPDRGWTPNWLVAGFGGLLVAATVLTVTALAARRAGAKSATAEPAQTSRRRFTLVARRAWTAAGIGLALGDMRRRRGVPMRTVIVAVIVGLAGVVAASTFALALDRLTSNPARYGWAADFAIVDATNTRHVPFIEQLIRDRRTDAVAVVRSAPVRVEGQTVAGYSIVQRKGLLEWTLSRGHMPLAPGEAVLGSRFADQIGADIGSTVHVSSRDVDFALRVVGVGIGPTLQNERLGRQILMRKAPFDTVARDTASSDALIRLLPGVNVDKFMAQLGSEVELSSRRAPEEVRNLQQLGALPFALAAFLAGVAVIALVNGLVTTLRRQARDIAVLRTLGLTPVQARGSVVTAALVVIGIGVLVGVPLGFALGRLIWAAVASVTAVGTDVAAPTLALVVLAPAAVAIALIAALVLGARAATMRPAAVLRAE